MCDGRGGDLRLLKRMKASSTVILSVAIKRNEPFFKKTMMRFVAIGNNHINPRSIDAIELNNEPSIESWWFSVRVGKNSYGSKFFTTENAAIIAKNEFIEKCQLATAPPKKISDYSRDNKYGKKV